MANFNFNKVIVGGRLVDQPSLSTTQNGLQMTRFSVAVSRPKTKDGAQTDSDFIKCTAWGKTAEFISKFFNKGSSICAVGRLTTNRYTDKEGKNKTDTVVTVEEATFVDSRNEVAQTETPLQTQSQSYSNQQRNNYAQNKSQPQTQQKSTAPRFDDLNDDDELPF